jgi:hypothetical protein
MFIPYGMSPFHVFVAITSIWAWRFWLNLTALLAWASTAWILRTRRVLLFLFGYTIVTLLPLLNISGIGENVFADRYLYIPTLASALLIPLLARENEGFSPDYS